MRRYLWPVTVVTIVAISLGTTEYVKIANERGHLFSQLEEAASVVSENPAESAEALAALERGTLIAAGGPEGNCVNENEYIKTYWQNSIFCY